VWICVSHPPLVLQEEKFEIPDMFTEHPSADQKSMEQYDTMQKDHKKAFKKTWPFSDVSPWFR